jgi:hypothetical protein
MKHHRYDRTDTGDYAREVRVYGQEGVCPYKKGIEIQNVGANTGVRPVFPLVHSTKNPKIKTFRRL